FSPAKIRPIQVPTNAPAMPRRIVMIQPPGSFPGINNFGMAPTTRPISGTHRIDGELKSIMSPGLSGSLRDGKTLRNDGCAALVLVRVESLAPRECLRLPEFRSTISRSARYRDSTQ